MTDSDTTDAFLDSFFNGKYYSPRVVAQMLEVDDSTIRRWVSANKLPHIRVGSAIRIKDSDLREFIIGNQPLLNEGT
jgi:excisionase family DNA binding protein